MKYTDVDVKLPKEVDEQVVELSKELGISEEEYIRNSVAYLTKMIKMVPSRTGKNSSKP